MKLLFDQNLSPRLAEALQDLYPGSIHVRHVGLKTASDEQIWSYALDNGLAIVSKDADFRQRSFRYGPPPKVIWIRLGNCSTNRIEALLRAHWNTVLRFLEDAGSAFLALR